jgi:hypothetical protein
MRPVRGPNHNHPAVRYDRIQRLIAAGLKRRVVIGITLGALALRLATLTWGAGLGAYEGMYHPDERAVWESAQNFPESYRTNKNFAHGTAVQYAVGALLLPAKARWNAGEPLIPGMTYVQFVLLSVRAVHALLGALAVLVVYRLGRMLVDRSTGLAAAALLAVSFYHALTSAFTTLDAPAGSLVALIVVLAARAARTGQRREFVWLGVTAGVLLATQVTATLVFVAVVALLVYALVPARGAATSQADASALGDTPAPGARAVLSGSVVAGGVAAAVLVIAMPHVVTDPRGFIGSIVDRFAGTIGDAPSPLAILGAKAYALSVTMTAPVALLALAGLLVTPFVASREFRGLHLALLLLLLVDVVFWGASAPPRHLVPVVPILCVYAAVPIALLFRARWIMARTVAAAVATFFVAYSLHHTLLGIEHRRSDSRTAAAAYIATQLPRGATIALAPTTARDPWTAHPWRYPKLPPGSFELVSMLDRPQFIVTTSYALDDVTSALRSGELGADRVWPERLASRWYNSLAPTPEEFRFHQSLLDGSAGYVLERRWPKTARVPLEFPAPEIRLYRLTTDDADYPTRAPDAAGPSRARRGSRG